MIYNSVLSVEMCNSDGCGEAYTDVARSTHRPQVEGAVSAQWQDAIPIDPYNITIEVGYESYTRILQAELFYAFYGVSTSGARNGYVKHVQTTDALLWEAGKRLPEWNVVYHMVPSWAGYEIAEIADSLPGCWLAQNRFPYNNVSPRCTVPAEFARAGTAGVGHIHDIIAHGSAYGSPPMAFGALDLTINP